MLDCDSPLDTERCLSGFSDDELDVFASTQRTASKDLAWRMDQKVQNLKEVLQTEIKTRNQYRDVLQRLELRNLAVAKENSRLKRKMSALTPYLSTRPSDVSTDTTTTSFPLKIEYQEDSDCEDIIFPLER